MIGLSHEFRAPSLTCDMQAVVLCCVCLLALVVSWSSPTHSREFRHLGTDLLPVHPELFPKNVCCCHRG